MYIYGRIQSDLNKIWCVTFYGKFKNERGMHNRNMNIIAVTMEEAIEKLRQDAPDAALVSIVHKGIIDID